MGLMEIIYRLTHFLHREQIRPDKIRITVEFLDPEDDHRAEYELRTKAQGIYADTKMIDSVCDGRDFIVMGINFKVKRYEYPRRPLRKCICKFCLGH